MKKAMRILIISDNNQIKSEIKNIFEKNKLKVEIQESININLKNDLFIQYLISEYDLIISAHCKKIFPKKLVESVRCINIHPGYNPYNRGWYPQVFSIINNLPIGATIHEMDENLDSGYIISQSQVEIKETDNSLDVYNRVFEKEIELFNNNFDIIINNKYQKNKPINEGNLNKISDFKKLCKIDINQVGTFKEHIDILRALTHGDFKNAFYENKNGEKIFIKIYLEKDV
jgi:methionyl-tRNA formyltransferase